MASKKQKMSPEEYQKSEANTEKLSYPAVTKRLREKRSLPNVTKIEEFSRFYVLHVVSDKNTLQSGSGS